LHVFTSGNEVLTSDQVALLFFFPASRMTNAAWTLGNGPYTTKNATLSLQDGALQLPDAALSLRKIDNLEYFLS
jgi:hypothetical protein